MEIIFIISNRDVSESACEIDELLANYFSCSEFAYVWLSNQLAFESKLLVFHKLNSSAIDEVGGWCLYGWWEGKRPS